MTMAENTLDVTVQAAAALGAGLSRAFDPRTPQPGEPAGRPPDVTWPLDGGQAWVYRVPGNDQVTQPVIIADGFGAGASTLAEWAGLWEETGNADLHPWGTQLHQQGRDVIVLGYDSRNVPIADNAAVAMECIRTTLAEQDGTAPLVVGGLSMGGLVTRYALCQPQMQDTLEHVATYFSYDSPHRGAWIPISLQVFAHFLASLADFVEDEEQKKELAGMSDLINSPAARELLWKHTDTFRSLDTTFTADPARDAFVAALEAAGSYPAGVTTLAVANGRGDGIGLEGVTPGEANLVWPPALFAPSATLYAQAAGTDQRVARLSSLILPIKTSGIPALDGAPGGTLNSFGIAAEALEKAGFEATAAFPDVCFVPAASAVDLADPSDPYAPVEDMDPDTSGVDAFKVASDNESHTRMTAHLCDWLTERF
jgi:hypothetical protein